jgi:uncharacterized membrane protein
MSQLIALVFDDPYKADEARAALLRMAGEGQLELKEMAVISKPPNGKTRVSQDQDVVAHDQHLGHVAGLLTAAVTGTVPFILAGTIGGRLIGKFTDHGVTNAFITNVKQEVQPGKSCLMVFGGADARHRTVIVERLRPFQPRVIESDLPKEVVDAVNQALQTERT